MNTFALGDYAAFLRKHIESTHFLMSVIVDTTPLERDDNIEAKMLDMLEKKKGVRVIASALGFLPLAFPEACDWTNRGFIYSLKTGCENAYQVAQEIFDISFEESVYIFSENTYRKKPIKPLDVAIRLSEVCAYGFPELCEA
jgi:hypothetical protein